MKIDWFTFAAQIINFLVLVALLRWLLYDPIVRAMKRREEKIADRLEEAARKREEAQEKVQDYEEKSRQLDEKRDELLKEARHQVHEERHRLLNETKQEVERRREQWQEALHREQEDFLSDLRRQAGEMGLHAARRTLAQLADAELQQRMCDVFASRLGHLGDEQRDEMLRRVGNGETEAFVRSAFDLSGDQRERLRQTVRETLNTVAEVSFEQSADLICGVELDVGGYRFGWNVKDFLRDLEMGFSERLKDKH
jgi:F-type H+-transporting ATPase subunit b